MSTITVRRKMTTVVTAVVASAAVGVGGTALGVELAPAKSQKKQVAEAAQLPKGKTMPVHKFRVSAAWGNSSGPHAGRSHAGVDFAAATNEPVYAATAGKVVQVGYHGGYGKMVKVRDKYGKSALYAHLNKYGVKRGQKVQVGQRIGAVGNTGNSTGPHLHFEVRTKRDRVANPYKYLKANNSELVKIGTKIQRKSGK